MGMHMSWLLSYVVVLSSDGQVIVDVMDFAILG